MDSQVLMSTEYFFRLFHECVFFFYSHSFLTTNETDIGSQILIKYNQVLLYKHCMLDSQSNFDITDLASLETCQNACM